MVFGTQHNKDDVYWPLGMQDYILLQRIEAEEHKWYLGEKMKRPISFNDAWLDYIINGHADDFRKRFNDHKPDLLKARDEGEIERIIQNKDGPALKRLMN